MSRSRHTLPHKHQRRILLCRTTTVTAWSGWRTWCRGVWPGRWRESVCSWRLGTWLSSASCVARRLRLHRMTTTTTATSACDVHEGLNTPVCKERKNELHIDKKKET
eukprot:Rmarinus@m.20190